MLNRLCGPPAPAACGDRRPWGRLAALASAHTRRLALLAPGRAQKSVRVQT
jgi:hypothetical protein